MYKSIFQLLVEGVFFVVTFKFISLILLEKRFYFILCLSFNKNIRQHFVGPFHSLLFWQTCLRNFLVQKETIRLNVDGDVVVVSAVLVAAVVVVVVVGAVEMSVQETLNAFFGNALGWQQSGLEVLLHFARRKDSMQGTTSERETVCVRERVRITK